MLLSSELSFWLVIPSLGLRWSQGARGRVLCVVCWPPRALWATSTCSATSWSAATTFNDVIATSINDVIATTNNNVIATTNNVVIVTTNNDVIATTNNVVIATNNDVCDCYHCSVSITSSVLSASTVLCVFLKTIRLLNCG